MFVGLVLFTGTSNYCFICTQISITNNHGIVCLDYKGGAQDHKHVNHVYSVTRSLTVNSNNQ